MTFELRARPTALDVARGATASHLGYYYGETRDRHPDVELPALGLGGLSIPDETSPHGVIVIFVGQIKPLSVRRFTEVVCHEIAHVLGYQEHEIVNDLGLAP